MICFCHGQNSQASQFFLFTLLTHVAFLSSLAKYTTGISLGFFCFYTFVTDQQLTILNIALYAYDCVLTADSEVDLIWPNPVKLGSLLYLANRYGFLMYNILEIFMYIPTITNKVSFIIVLSLRIWLGLTVSV